MRESGDAKELLVDKARPESFTTVPAPDAYAWPTAHKREVFYKFIDQVKLAIAQWEYTPAEVAG